MPDETSFVYADNAATTQVRKPVLQAMMPWFCEQYGNPSSVYSIGREAHAAVDKARRQVAAALHARPEEIFFTSGGSEADNWALRGAALAKKAQGRHIISTEFEHHAILHTLHALERDGFEITLLRPDAQGFIHPEDLLAALREDTVLVSVMYANNEVGTIQPIPTLAQICRERGVLFHTDAVQAVGHIPVDTAKDGMDLLSLSAHKFHGPKGVGVLFCRAGLRLPNLIEGGGQEHGRRAGTENVPGIVGLGEAISLASGLLQTEGSRIAALRGRLIDGLLTIRGVHLNGSRENSLPGIVNITADGIEGEPLLMLLDMKGICASAGSACAAGSLEPSHVLTAMGLSHKAAHGSLRLSLSGFNTAEEVDYICRTVAFQIDRLRALSPANN